MRRLFALCVALDLGLAACSPSSHHAATASTSCSAGIVNGYNLSARTPVGSSTVFLEIKDIDGKFFGCSGTLIDRQLILTAQHCVDGAAKIGVVFSAAAITPERDLGTPFVLADGWAKYTPSGHVTPHDLAIVHIPGPAPAAYSVQPLPSPSYNVKEASAFMVAGYGITSECAADDGTLRATTFSSDDLLQTGVINQNGQQYGYVEPGMLMLDQSQTGICEGDSGGPLYAEINGRLQLVGVTSFVVDTDDETNEAHVCHGLGLFTDLRLNLDWISAASAQLKAGPLDGLMTVNPATN